MSTQLISTLRICLHCQRSSYCLVIGRSWRLWGIFCTWKSKWLLITSSTARWTYMRSKNFRTPIATQFGSRNLVHAERSLRLVARMLWSRFGQSRLLKTSWFFSKNRVGSWKNTQVMYLTFHGTKIQNYLFPVVLTARWSCGVSKKTKKKISHYQR